MLPTDASSGTTGEWPQCSLLTKYFFYSPVFPKLQVRVTCFFNPWHVGIAIVENETLTVIDRTGYLLISYSSSVLKYIGAGVLTQIYAHPLQWIVIVFHISL